MFEQCASCGEPLHDDVDWIENVEAVPDEFQPAPDPAAFVLCEPCLMIWQMYGSGFWGEDE